MIRTMLNGHPGLRRPPGLRRRASGLPDHAHSAANALARAPLALMVVDAAGLLVGVEGASAGPLRALVGRSAFELADGARFLPDDGAPCSAEAALRRALDGEDLAGLAFVHGRVYEARSTARIHGDAVSGTCIVALDVTRRHARQERCVREDRMAALATLAAGVANEINNPLTYVLINIDHVARGLRRLGALDAAEVPSGAELSAAFAGFVEALTSVSNGANRVRGVIRDILVFAQGNNAPRALVDVRAVIESSLQVAWHKVRHRARIVKQLAEVPPLEGSSTQLAHVFLQLFVNAADAIPQGNAEHEEVRVTTRCDANGDVVVEVLDTGRGIAPEALPYVFEPFFTTRGVGDGVGLGLSICHGIVRQMGGRMSVESGAGRGSLFRVELPTGRRPSSHPPRALDTPPCRMLVLDADPLIGEAIARSLGDVELTIAADVRQATQSLLSHRFDVVLCDLMLPETSGVDFYVHMLRTAPHLVKRIVFMAGGASTARARAFLSSISNPCLEKPIDMSELRRLVARVGIIN